ncbi:MAG TPA: conjugative transfer protein MobI(A/C) [Lamprocystis sp. (in: g-proteobacteria)]|nr:conjugative transfer protein MobI(A/C) [Lamprocystis sp. (in: g-proteobacteria)]
MQVGSEAVVWHDPGGQVRERAWPGDAPSIAAELDAWVQVELEALRQEAEQVQWRFDAEHQAAGQGRPRSEWGRVGVRIKEQRSSRATPGGFSVEWCTYSYVNRPQGKACFTEYIKKGDGDRYPRNAFRKVARDWQRPLIDAAEDDFAAIRRAVRAVAQVRTQLRLAVRTGRDLRTQLRERDGR